MATTLGREIHVAERGVARKAPPDTGAQLSRALLSYLVVLIAALTLLPFEFSVPNELRADWTFTPLSVLETLAMFVPYGFLSCRARLHKAGRHVLAIAASATVLALALESVQLFARAGAASPWHLIAAAVGAGIGGAVCAYLHSDASEARNSVTALLLQLPLMGLMYLLLPLLWASTSTARDDVWRLALTLAIGATGASILGSIARATRAYTPERPWWLVPTVAAGWITIGALPSLTVDWRITVAIIATVTAFAAWRGRWTAPMFVDRRFEVPSLLAATPFMALYYIGAGVWPGKSFRTIPLMQIGLPTNEGGLALALPLLESAIAATVLGYVIAEWRGRQEHAFRESLSTILFQALVVIVACEVSRSIFGYEGASLLRLTLSAMMSAYGAWMYHLQRAHIKTVAHRVKAGR
jgi:hypothetical protein